MGAGGGGVGANFIIISVSFVNGQLYERHREKTCFCHMRTTKAQISLRICAV